MDTNYEDREERLPAWARNLIRGLRAESSEFRRLLTDTDPESSLIVVDPYSDQPRGIDGNLTRVRFANQVDVMVRDGRVEVYSVDGGRLQIVPIATNVVEVSPLKN